EDRLGRGPVLVLLPRRRDGVGGWQRRHGLSFSARLDRLRHLPVRRVCPGYVVAGHDLRQVVDQRDGDGAADVHAALLRVEQAQEGRAVRVIGDRLRAGDVPQHPTGTLDVLERRRGERQRQARLQRGGHVVRRRSSRPLVFAVAHRRTPSTHASGTEESSKSSASASVPLPSAYRRCTAWRFCAAAWERPIAAYAPQAQIVASPASHSASLGEVELANQPSGPEATAMPSENTREWTLSIEERLAEGTALCKSVS